MTRRSSSSSSSSKGKQGKKSRDNKVASSSSCTPNTTTTAASASGWSNSNNKMWSLGSIVVVTIGVIWAAWIQTLQTSPVLLPQHETQQQQQQQQQAKETSSPPTTTTTTLPALVPLPPPLPIPPVVVVAPIGPFYEILQVHPHDSEAFTQGLVYDEQHDWMVEGTGNYGASEIRIYNVTTPDQILQRQALPAHYFGEGICIFDDNDNDDNDTTTDAENSSSQRFIIQLEYKTQRGFVYPYHPPPPPAAAPTTTETETPTTTTTHTTIIPPLVLGPASQEFNYETTTTEGWGITYNPIDKVFYVTDGSEYIHVWDRNALLSWGNKKKKKKTTTTTRTTTTNDDDNDKDEDDNRTRDSYELRKVKVTLVREARTTSSNDDGTTTTTTTTTPPLSIRQLNELEWDPSTRTILANLWYQNVIVRIDPTTGQVLMVYDLSQLYTNRVNTADCLNGIAGTGPTTPQELFVTGKWWPHLYRIRLLR